MGEPMLLYGMRLSQSRQEKLQRFVNKILADGNPRGRAHFVSNLPNSVYRDMRNKGVNLESDHIFISDNTVLKYLTHAKSSKGATLPFNQFWKLVNIAGKPKGIYIDTNRNRLVYVFASRQGNGMVTKVVIEPNYKFKKKKCNMITSIGVVHKREMTHGQFKKVEC